MATLRPEGIYGSGVSPAALLAVLLLDAVFAGISRLRNVFAVPEAALGALRRLSARREFHRARRYRGLYRAVQRRCRRPGIILILAAAFIPGANPFRALV